MIQNFIITRFNLRSSRRGEVPNDNWRKYRLDIFRKYCYPSVMNQTFQDFEWFMIVDGSTDKDLFKEYPEIIPIYQMDYNNFACSRYIAPEIKKRVKNKTKWIITTRLDSDDSLRDDFMEQIQKLFIKEEYVMYFRTGIFLNIEDGRQKLFRFPFPPGSFVSCAEPWTGKPLKTSYYCAHKNLKKYFKERAVENSDPMWVQIIHNMNLSTRFDSSFTFAAKDVDRNLKRFNMLDEVDN